MTALLVLYAAVAVLDWLAVARRRTRLEYAAKPGAMVVLIAAALAMDPADETARVALVIALAFSLAGDVALMLPGREAGSGGPNLFLAGLAAFLLGHVAFVAGFAIEGVEGAWLGAGAFVVVAIVVFIGRPVVAAAGRTAPEMRLPVACYVGVIGAMVLFGVGTGDARAIVGALLFASSDSMIARERFIAPIPGGRLGIIVTYHAAQALLLLSFT